jgi:hypothetical protein
MTAILLISATAGSADRSSGTPNTVAVSTTSDANMAWMLAIAADACLTGYERTKIFVELGCGENHLAIERILHAIISRRVALPVAIFERLARWLDGYAGSPEEPRLRKMLGEIGAQQFRRVPLCIRRAPCRDVGTTVVRTKHVVLLGSLGQSAPVARDNTTLEREPS